MRHHASTYDDLDQRATPPLVGDLVIDAPQHACDLTSNQPRRVWLMQSAEARFEGGALKRNMSARLRAGGWNGWPPSRTTCARPCNGRSKATPRRIRRV